MAFASEPELGCGIAKIDQKCVQIPVLNDQWCKYNNEIYYLEITKFYYLTDASYDKYNNNYWHKSCSVVRCPL